MDTQDAKVIEMKLSLKFEEHNTTEMKRLLRLGHPKWEK